MPKPLAANPLTDKAVMADESILRQFAQLGVWSRGEEWRVRVEGWG
jgi:hypothetical protein